MQGLRELFGPTGALARSLRGFVPRSGQQRMAERIAEALQLRQVVLIEAGTGTGKTFAYLVPALLSGRRVLISTGTRTLQDQLFARDLPLLGAALGRPVRTALLKGRANYLCRARLDSGAAQGELLGDAGGALAARVREWAALTRTGDLAEVSDLTDTHPLRPRITSTRENCTGGKCAEFSRCHVFAARRAALEAELIVVNHHLLLADLALKEDGFGDLLPSVDALILDEAHQLPDLAAEFFGPPAAAGSSMSLYRTCGSSCASRARRRARSRPACGCSRSRSTRRWQAFAGPSDALPGPSFRAPSRAALRRSRAPSGNAPPPWPRYWRGQVSRPPGARRGSGAGDHDDSKH